MRIRAEIKWDDNGDTMEVIFETNCDGPEEGGAEDDTIFFYGYEPVKGDHFEWDGWMVTEVYGEDN